MVRSRISDSVYTIDKLVPNVAAIKKPAAPMPQIGCVTASQ
ncbi:MAG: hypothetical protein ACI95C_002348 [Pseudohongiellaceae bacterium]|jgi:hypothetical protein